MQICRISVLRAVRIWFIEHQIFVMLQDIVLDFSPGPIFAVDGDRTLSSPISYAILSGTTYTPVKVHLYDMLNLHVFTCNCVCAHDRRRWRAFQDGKRDRWNDIGSWGQRQTYNSGAASSSHGKTHMLFYWYKWLSLAIFLFFNFVSVLHPGLPGQRPQEVFCCYSLGPNFGSKPVLSRVWHGWISWLCDRRKDSILSGQYIWQQSTDVACAGPRLQSSKPCVIHTCGTCGAKMLEAILDLFS